MFRFPVRDAVRCRIWISNSGNAALANIDPESLKNKRICSKHFSEIYTRSKKLPCNAVPLRYIQDDTSSDDQSDEELPLPTMIDVQNIKTYAGPSKIKRSIQNTVNINDDSSSDVSSKSKDVDKTWLMELQNLPSHSTGSAGKNKILREENESLKKALLLSRKKNNNLKVKLKSAKKKIMSLQQFTKGNFNESSITGFSKSLMNMQIRHREKNPLSIVQNH